MRRQIWKRLRQLWGEVPFNNVPLSLWGNVYSPGYSYTTLTNGIHLLFLGQDLASILGYVYPLRGCAELAHALKPRLTNVAATL